MSEHIKDLAKLREPFPASAISKLPKGGVMLDFVGHASVTDRLLSVDPEWTWEPVALDERGLPCMDYDAQGKPVGLWIRLTICGVSRLGYGTCEARKTEPVKELIGDALRNAAMRFGVALELWSKAELESQHSESNHAHNGTQNGTQPQNGQRPAPRPESAPQAATGAGNGKPGALKLSPMQKLMEKCERNGVGLTSEGKPVPNYLVNILKAENFSAIITEENWEAAFNVIREHSEKKFGDKELVTSDTRKQGLQKIQEQYPEDDDSDPFADE